MKVVITGSHFSPAYAVIRKSNWKVVVIGRKYALSNTETVSYEYKLCKDKKIPFEVLDVPRFLRVSPLKSLLSSSSFLKSIKKARKILKEVRPDVVLSFGGYTALPVAIAAFTLKIPLAIHEQTLGAGLSNRLSAFFADRVFISFNSSRRFFPKKKTYLTGNPIREEIMNARNLPFVVRTDRKIIYVTGGSTGSMAVNDLLGKIIPSLSDYFIIHQYGVSSENTFHALDNYFGKPFFSPQEVAWIMNNASLIISRSGINTVSEILYLGTPSIFIPLPYGQKNEQLKNARYAQKHGRVQYFIQEKVTSNQLLKAVRDMIKKGKSKKPTEIMRRSALATDVIIDETEKLNKKTTKAKTKRN